MSVALGRRDADQQAQRHEQMKKTLRTRLHALMPRLIGPIGRREMKRRCRLVEVGPGQYRATGTGPLIEVVPR